VLLLTAGLIVTAVLTTVVLNIDVGLEGQTQVALPTNVPGVEPPSLLKQGEGGTAANQMQNDPGLATTGRAWIQVTENGRLSQEYRYARSEPAPNGRIEMTDPEVKVFLKDNRVLTMSGRHALVRVPRQALESGSMTGNVIIRLFETTGGLAPDASTNTPLLEVRTEEASYDNFQGDIHCPGDVDVQTATAWLPATGLRLQINDVEGRPGQLTIDRINGELRLAESVQQRHAKADRARAAADAGPRSVPVEAAPLSAQASSERAARPQRERDADAPRSSRSLQRQRDRIAQRREQRSSGSTPDSRSPDAGPFYYRLTLNEDVRIRQGDGTSGWTARGDTLHIVFSLDNSDLDQSMTSSAAIEPSRTLGPPTPMTLSSAMASVVLASTHSPQEDSQPLASAAHQISGGLFIPSEHDTIITCDGPLTMVPLQNAAEHPASPEDSRFELLGQPVTLHNHDDATTITCEALRYASLSEIMELAGGSRHPLTIDSPELYARGERFWVDRINSAGALEGPGWMAAGENTNPGAGPPLPPELRGDVRIAWRDGVDLEFARTESPVTPQDSESGEQSASPHNSFGRLRLAVFDGDVAVDSPDFTLSAQVMAVGFPQAGAADDVQSSTAPAAPEQGLATQQRLAGIEFMHAQEHVLAGSLSDGGSIACDDLRVEFTSHSGKTVPARMIAMGGVAASDPDRQTVWSDHLEVAFKPVATTVRETGAASLPLASTAPDDAARADAKRRADVDTLTATGSVQILMADGARVFADRLVADGHGNKVVLLGEDILVASDRTVISKGKRLELTAQGDRVLWPGPGEFAYYTSAVVEANNRGRVSRPQVDLTANPRQMLATWQESMLYDALFDGGAGSIVIRGQVDAQSTPSPLELNVATGDEVTLVFASKTQSAGDSPEATVVQPSASAPDQSLFSMDQRSRQLREIIATGNATMESRTWLNADHSDKPRVFYLKGPHIRYNDQSLEAVVTGKGELLVRDERLETPATRPEATSQPAQPMVEFVPVTRRKADLPFGGKGTTLFRWTGSLTMTRTQPGGTLYDIAMLDGVEVRHRALDQTISTMTGERLEATVDRSAGDTQQRDAGFDLGGSMDLRRIHAQGNVYVDSPTRDVDCDDFDYDYATGIARLAAAEGRVVTLITANNPHPVQAKLFIWNTIEDTVQAQKVSGSSGR
jgi:hypothetical protein